MAASDPIAFSRPALRTEPAYEPVAVMARDGYVESIHRGAITIVDGQGRLCGGVGDPGFSLLLRSAAKPFQALAVVESGAADALGITQKELALMCGSHAGRAEHVEVVTALLERLGMTADSLVCGLTSHTCSGKHAGMIALALHLGVPVEGYEQVTHPVQQAIARTIRGLLGLEASVVSAGEAPQWPLAPGGPAPEPPRGSTSTLPLLVGIDGCGVPIVKTTLRDAAYLLALLAAGATPGLARVRAAMMAHPQLIAGEGKFDTGLMQAAPGRIVAKAGAEGIMALGFVAGPADGGPEGNPTAGPARSPGTSIGCFIKIADGSPRAIPALVKPCLEAYGVHVPEEALAQGRPRTAERLRGIIPGEIVSLVEPERLRRPPVGGGMSEGPVEEAASLENSGLKVVTARGDERAIASFLREEWPSSDRETFGRPIEWAAEPFSLMVRRRRRVVAVLRGHFTGGLGSVDELMVKKEERGTGLGSLLLARFEAEAVARKCTRIVLRAVKDSSAERFYHEQGYRRECVEWSHEFGYDYVRLMRTLERTE